MPALRDQFAHFYMPDENAIATAMKTGLVIPAANVLLNLYRFQTTARDELFGALEKLGDRLWIPHQVGLEFHRNRLGVMKAQEGYFDTTLKDLHAALEDFRSKVRAFKRRLSLNGDDMREIEQAISGLDELVSTEIIKGKEFNEVWLSDHAQDEVLARVDALFENRVGSPMEPMELEEACREAERRVREKIPPGYMDRRKDHSAGDYLVWRQLMTEARTRKPPAVVLITDDMKEDWYQREHGRIVGARRELREEMTREAGVALLIMTTDTFLRHAEKYLKAEVSEETVDQARGFENRYAGTDAADIARSAWYDILARSIEASGLGDELHDTVLERIRSSEADSAMELRLWLRLLASQIGDSQAVNIVMQAIEDGRASGKLTLSRTLDGFNVVQEHVRQQESQSQAPLDEPPAED